MINLGVHLTKHKTNLSFIVAKQCTIILASQEGKNGIAESPALNPTRDLNIGDKVELCQSNTESSGIKVKLPNEYAWIDRNEVSKIEVKEYRDMTDSEIKISVKRISNSSNTVNEVRQRIVNELGYPYSKEGITVHMVSQIGYSVSVWSSKGKGISV